MASNKLAFRADLKLADATLAAIDAATAAQADHGQRPHLGASVIGQPCGRALWYGFRWASAVQHEPRLLRLFERGQREEANLTALLRSAGVTVHSVDPHTGRQFSFGNGHFGGSMDGAALGLPDAPKTWHVLEYKTHATKSFNELAAKGVQEAKPAHWAQMQCYMAWTGMERALYVAVCKDDDRLHLERIDADHTAQQQLMERAQRIIDAPTPPDGISDDAAYYLCKWCDHAALCHGSAAPVPNCRTCSHSTPEPGGTWTCARHSAQVLDVSAQRAGCQAHRFIPALLRKWATPVDASEVDNWVQYQTQSGTFINGAQPEAFSSMEIYAAQDKAALAMIEADSSLKTLRREFGAEVVA